MLIAGPARPSSSTGRLLAPVFFQCILRGMRHSPSSQFALLVTLALLLSGFGACGEAPWLSGRILVERDGNTQPVGGAKISLFPVEPLAKGKQAPEDVRNLSGSAVTRDGGTFEFSELSSNVSYDSFELLTNWRYRLHIEDTAYYLKDISFDFEAGNNYVEIRLQEKKADVEAGEGEGIGKDENRSTTGTVRRL